MTERITATVPQFCRLSGLGKTKVFSLIKNGTLESIKLGQSRLIVLASYQRLIEAGSKDGNGHGYEAEMTKLWCIAIAMGGPEDGLVVVGMQMSGLQEMAVAQAVSDVYRQTGTKLPLMGVNARELTREYLVEALRLIDEGEQKSPHVVPLPRIVGGVMQPTTEADQHPAEREMIRQAMAADHLEKRYGMKPIPLSEGPGPADEDEPA